MRGIGRARRPGGQQRLAADRDEASVTQRAQGQQFVAKFGDDIGDRTRRMADQMARPRSRRRAPGDPGLAGAAQGMEEYRIRAEIDRVEEASVGGEADPMGMRATLPQGVRSLAAMLADHRRGGDAVAPHPVDRDRAGRVIRHRQMAPGGIDRDMTGIVAAAGQAGPEGHDTRADVAALRPARK